MLEEQLDGFKILCFHSRFTSSDRAEIENNLLKMVGRDSKPDSRNKLIVVGTQVIEQSLDLDFDYMITELCPMDLLLQRSGRLHRHDCRVRPQNLEKPVISVLKTDNKKASEYIYTKWILNQTEKYLPESFQIPSCIPELVGKVYADSEESSIEWDEYKKKISDKKEKAKKYCIKSDQLTKKRKNTLCDFLDDNVGNNDMAEASVRDGDETIQVLIMQKGEGNLYKLLNGTEFDITVSLSESEAVAIARERVNLPSSFTKGKNFQNTISQLTKMPERWNENSLLKGELLLLLDENKETELLGRTLSYSRKFGLQEIKDIGE